MVSGGRSSEVGGRYGVTVDTHVARAYDGLGEAGVAILHFVVVLHGFITGLVGEAVTVGHEVAVYDFLVHAGTSVGGGQCICVCLVHNILRPVVVTS